MSLHNTTSLKPRDDEATTQIECVDRPNLGQK